MKSTSIYPPAMATIVMLAAGVATAQVTTLVPAGDDCWSTGCGRTNATFCDSPIPASFFDPGSEPFDGVVLLGGDTGGAADTRVRRRTDMVLLLDGPPETVPIELVQLSLMSCSPITVNTGGSPVLWDVSVQLSPSQNPPPGSMTVTKQHPNGGVFTSQFNVKPLFIFRKQSDPSQQRFLDTGQLPIQPDMLHGLGEMPWVHQADPAVQATPCGINFVPGVMQQLKGKDAGSQCCVDVCHAGATATHCVVVSRDCSACGWGSCCIPGHSHGRCAIAKASRSQTAEQACLARGGSYGGDGTSCTDSDGDGLDDLMENGDCCGPRDTCHTGTKATNPDTDGDGFDDGTELRAGSDPCDPLSSPN